MAPRTPAQNQALRDATRAKILEAAMRAFAEQGYAGASVRRIADEAGMAPGLMYRHFESKREVLRAIFSRSMEDVDASFAAAQGDGEGPPLARLIRAAFSILRGNLPFWKLSYGIRMQEAALRDLGPDLEIWTGRIRAVLESHFRALGSPRPQDEAAILFAAIDGISQHYALDPGRYPLDAVAEALIAKYPPTPKRKAGPHGRASRSRRPRRT